MKLLKALDLIFGLVLFRICKQLEMGSNLVLTFEQLLVGVKNPGWGLRMVDDPFHHKNSTWLGLVLHPRNPNTTVQPTKTLLFRIIYR